MPRLYLVADLHCKANPDDNALVEVRLAAILEGSDPGDWLAVLGDVTNSGTSEQYAEALRILTPWAGRLLLCPGNHDAGPLGLLYSVAARRRFSALRKALRCPPSVRIGHRLCVALDSCRYTLWPGDLARGRLGGGELARAAQAIKDARKAGLLPTMLLHHDPYCEDPTLALDDAGDLLGLASGAADLAWGHTHHVKRWVEEGRERVSVGDLKGGGRKCWLGGG